MYALHRLAAKADEQVPTKQSKEEFSSEVAARKAHIKALDEAIAAKERSLEEVQCEEEEMGGLLAMAKNERKWEEQKKEAAQEEREAEEAKAAACRVQVSKVCGKRGVTA
jgi:hypothetical protein